jgi:hypothetical protein
VRAVLDRAGRAWYPGALAGHPSAAIATQEGGTLQIDKNTILGLLRERGQQDQASQAEQELPDQVDTDQGAGLLQRFGIDPQELLQRFMGGGMPKL